MSVAALISAVLCLLAALVALALSLRAASPDLRRFGRWAAALCALALLLEGAVFQYDALATRALSPLTLDPLTAQRQENEVTFTVPSLDVRTVRAVFSGKQEIARVTFSVQDAAYADGFAEAYSTLISPGSARCQVAYARIDSHGGLRALRITCPEGAALEEATLNAPIPYAFSPLRLFALLLPALLTAAVLIFRLWRVPWQRCARHRLLYALAALLCMLLALWGDALCIPYAREPFAYTRALEYPFENSVSRYQVYTHALLYDSLAKGRLDIDETPDEALLALENPYDPTQREESGAPFLFDYALYDGHYYAYFGLTPVLVYFAPFRLLFGYLPAYTTAACFFALLTVAAAFLCVWEAARRFIRRVPLLLLCLGAAAVALGGNTLMLQACANRYSLSIACMQAFFYLTLWSALLACRQKKRAARSACFALCALCCFLTVWSRATGAVAAAGWLLPLFLCVLLQKKRPLRRRLLDAASFLAPLAVFAALVMLYNAARFDSPFEFGQTWQLTTEDIHYNRLSLRDLPQALYYAFFDGLRLSPEFPFITMATQYVNHSGNFFYSVPSAGALTMPVTWGLLWLFALPEKRRHGKLAVYSCALAVTVPLALLSYCIAGVAARYVCDLLPTLCLIGALTLMETAGEDALRYGRGHTALPACAMFALTLCVAVALVFSNSLNYIQRYAPDKYLYLYRIFSLL